MNATHDPGTQVLLIEDDATTVQWIQAVAGDDTAGGLRVEAAADLATGLRRLAAGGIDLVLLDLALPDAAGLPIVQQVLALDPDRPVVVLTGTGDEQAARAALQMGVQDYLIKGVDRAPQLRRAIGYALERGRLRARLRESESRFRDFAEIEADWFWETGPDLRLSYVSDRAAAVWGEDAPRCMLGRRWPELLVTAGQQPIEQVFDPARRQAFSGVLCATSGGPERRLIRLAGKPLLGAGGRLLGLRGTGSDVTEQIRAEEFGERMMALLSVALEALPEGLALFDRDDRLALWNPKCVALFQGCAHLFVEGTAFLELLEQAAAAGTFPAAVADRRAWLAGWRARAGQAESSHSEALADGSVMEIRQVPSVQLGMLRLFRLVRDGEELRQEDGFG